MGRKPVGADPEEVYRTYLASNANAADTARSLNLPTCKVRDWRQRYGFDARFAEDTSGKKAVAIEAAKSSLAHSLVEALSLLSTEMFQAEYSKDRINAARALLDFYARTSVAHPSSLSLTLVDNRKLEDARNMGGSLIDTTARDILEANVLDATEQRQRVGKLIPN
jgi:hypothetical protein